MINCKINRKVKGIIGIVVIWKVIIFKVNLEVSLGEYNIRDIENEDFMF